MYTDDNWYVRRYARVYMYNKFFMTPFKTLDMTRILSWCSTTFVATFQH